MCAVWCLAALEAKIAKLGDNDADKRAMHTRALVPPTLPCLHWVHVVISCIRLLQTALSAKLAALEGATVSENDRSELLASMRDPWCDLLDQSKGSTITNPALFTKLTQHWEAEFHKDMQALNVWLARTRWITADMIGAQCRSYLRMCSRASQSTFPRLLHSSRRLSTTSLRMYHIRPLCIW
jgi:hypothetical protein